jgi:dCMP deaminase
MDRPTLKQTLMQVAFVIAQRSTCSRRKNGAVVATDKGVVLSTGYNGSLSGMDHCNHECNCRGGLVELLESPFTTEPHTKQCPAHENNGCNLAVHAEANAVYFAARNGVPTKGAIMYCTTEPCTKCAEAIIQSGIAEVVYSNKYRIRDGVNLLKAAGITVSREAYDTL